MSFPPSRKIIARTDGRCQKCGNAIPAWTECWLSDEDRKIKFCNPCYKSGVYPETPPQAPPKAPKFEAPKENKQHSPYIPPRYLGEPDPFSKPQTEVQTGSSRLDPDRPVSFRCSDGVDRVEIESVSQAIKIAMTEYAQVQSNVEYMNETCPYGGEWANNYTKEKMRNAIASPPAHLVDEVARIKRVIDEEIAMPQTNRRKVRRGLESGDEIDPDRYLVRSPNCWDEMRRTRTSKRVVTIGINVSVYCGEPAKNLLYRGAAAAALADALNERGINVRIVSFWSLDNMSTQSNKFVYSLQIKSALMPLDLPSVAFAAAEIAFARLIMLVGCGRAVPGQLNFGMGQAADVPKVDKDGIEFMLERSLTTDKQAIQWVKDQLIKTDEAVPV